MEFFKKRKVNLPTFWETYEASFEVPLPKQLKEVRFVVLDTETTGFDYEKDRILALGCLALKNNTMVANESFERYLDQHFYHADNVEIHGILRTENRAYSSELEVLQQFLAFIQNAVLVAHHAGFDIKMINKALERYGLPKLKNKVLDTAVLYRRTLIRSPLLEKKEHYSLDELADKFDISKKDRHTALGDAYITAIAFIKIVAKLKAKKPITLKKLLSQRMRL